MTENKNASAQSKLKNDTSIKKKKILFKTASNLSVSYFDTEISHSRPITSKCDAIEAENKFSKSSVTENVLAAPNIVPEKFVSGAFPVKPGASTAECVERIYDLVCLKNVADISNLELYKEIYLELITKLVKYQMRNKTRKYKKFIHKCPSDDETVPKTKSEMYKKDYRKPKINPKIKDKALKKWCALRSQPKKQILPVEPEPSPKVPLEMLMPRVKMLSSPHPRHRTVRWSHQTNKFTGLKYYPVNATSTQIIEQLLAESKPLPWPRVKSNEFIVFKTASNVSSTSTVRKLAEPKNLHIMKQELRYSVKPSAWNSSTTPRMIQLAELKQVYASSPKKIDLFSVQPSALNAAASPRITKLALPKVVKYRPFSVKNAEQRAVERFGQI